MLYIIIVTTYHVYITRCTSLFRSLTMIQEFLRKSTCNCLSNDQLENLRACNPGIRYILHLLCAKHWYKCVLGILNLLCAKHWCKCALGILHLLCAKYWCIYPLGILHLLCAKHWCKCALGILWSIFFYCIKHTNVWILTIIDIRINILK